MVPTQKHKYKSMEQDKKPRIANAIMKNNGELALFDFKIYCKAIVIKTVWYW